MLQSSDAIAVVHAFTVAVDDCDVAPHAEPMQHIIMSLLTQSASVKPTIPQGPTAWLQNAATMALHWSPTVVDPASTAPPSTPLAASDPPGSVNVQPTPAVTAPAASKGSRPDVLPDITRASALHA
jgi:hypothetical protein